MVSCIWRWGVASAVDGGGDGRVDSSDGPVDSGSANGSGVISLVFLELEPALLFSFLASCSMLAASFAYRSLTPLVELYTTEEPCTRDDLRVTAVFWDVGWRGSCCLFVDE